jgi:hypothetical protein
VVAIENIALGHSPKHGALEAADILRSGRAIAMSVHVIRAFIEQREKLVANAAILKRLAEIDKTLLEHDTALRDICSRLHESRRDDRLVSLLDREPRL